MFYWSIFLFIWTCVSVYVRCLQIIRLWSWPCDVTLLQIYVLPQYHYMYMHMSESLSSCTASFCPCPPFGLPLHSLAGFVAGRPGEEQKVTVSGREKRLTFNLSLTALRSLNTQYMQEEKGFMLCLLIGVLVLLYSNQKNLTYSVFTNVCVCVVGGMWCTVLD